MMQWIMKMSEIDDIKVEIANKMDVYEFLDVLDFTMLDLVEALEEQIQDKLEDFIEALH